MMNRILRLLAVALALFALNVQARTATMGTFENLPITDSRGQPASAAQIKAAVALGAGIKGWQVSANGNDSAIATVQVRGKHTVTTELVWSAGQFSVRYKDSINMNYTGTDIHPSYNAWVQGLVDAIRTAATRL